jgi:Predicted hydrolases or acyltransferases (alpha/beta hydrolase superfamily)
MPFLRVRDRKISYRSDGGGKNIVFIHGSGESKNSWIAQTELKDTFRIISFDLTGHGESSKSVPTMDIYIEDLNAIIEEICDSKPSIAGHSLGGAIAQRYALEDGETIEKLILVSTGARLRVAPIIFDMIENNFDGVPDMMEEMIFVEKPPRPTISKIKEEIRECGREILNRDFEICNKFDLMGEVDKINNETLVICGSEDVLTPKKYSTYLGKHIKNSSLSIIAGAGHMVMLEKPDEFNALVERFLGGE